MFCSLRSFSAWVRLSFSCAERKLLINSKRKMIKGFFIILSLSATKLVKYFLFDFFFFLRVVFDFIGFLFRWFLRGFQRLMNFFAFLFFFFCVNGFQPVYIRFGR